MVYLFPYFAAGEIGMPHSKGWAKKIADRHHSTAHGGRQRAAERVMISCTGAAAGTQAADCLAAHLGQELQQRASRAGYKCAQLDLPRRPRRCATLLRCFRQAPCWRSGQRLIPHTSVCGQCLASMPIGQDWRRLLTASFGRGSSGIFSAVVWLLLQDCLDAADL